MEINDFDRLFLTKMVKNRSPFAFLFRYAARFRRFRRLAVSGICRLEGEQMWSTTYRELMCVYYDVKIGLYSYGPCLLPDGLPEGTCIGNYCSFATGITAWRRNHPTDRFTQHPFFFNSALGLLKHDSIESIRDRPLKIEGDVWVGAKVIIAPGCKSIGVGAIIGAGAVVTKDVPPFVVVAGIPARQIGIRFTSEIRQVLLDSRWWEHPIDQLLPVLPLFLKEANLKSAERLRDHLQSLSH